MASNSRKHHSFRKSQLNWTPGGKNRRETSHDIKLYYILWSWNTLDPRNTKSMKIWKLEILIIICPLPTSIFTRSRNKGLLDCEWVGAKHLRATLTFLLELLCGHNSRCCFERGRPIPIFLSNIGQGSDNRSIDSKLKQHIPGVPKQRIIVQAALSRSELASKSGGAR